MTIYDLKHVILNITFERHKTQLTNLSKLGQYESGNGAILNQEGNAYFDLRWYTLYEHAILFNVFAYRGKSTSIHPNLMAHAVTATVPGS